MAANKTHAELLNALRSDRHAAEVAMAEHERDLCKARHADFVAAGGCDECGGRGWVVTWDTLDCLNGSYAEYGTCKKCNGEKRKGEAAHDPSYWTKYDRNRGVRYEAALPKTDAEKAKHEELTSKLSAAKAAEESLAEAMNPYAKGKKVRVYKGRKVPVGTTGTVFWVGEKVNNFGYRPTYEMRLGFKDDAGTVYWVNADNCEGVVEGF